MNTYVFQDLSFLHYHSLLALGLDRRDNLIILRPTECNIGEERGRLFNIFIRNRDGLISLSHYLLRYVHLLYVIKESVLFIFVGSGVGSGGYFCELGWWDGNLIGDRG